MTDGKCYFASCTAILTSGQYQIILLAEGTCVNNLHYIMNGQESHLLGYDPSTSTKPKTNIRRTNNTIL